MTLRYGYLIKRQTTERLETLYQNPRVKLERRNGSPRIYARTFLKVNGKTRHLLNTGEETLEAARKVAVHRTRRRVGTQASALRMESMSSNGGVLRGDVSSDDPLFAKLLLWTDANHNGISESWELRPASEVLASIGLGYMYTKKRDIHGNRFLINGTAMLRTAPAKNLPKVER